MCFSVEGRGRGRTSEMGWKWRLHNRCVGARRQGWQVGCMRLMQILETTCGPLEIFNFSHKSRTRQNSRRINQPANNSTHMRVCLPVCECVYVCDCASCNCCNGHGTETLWACHAPRRNYKCAHVTMCVRVSVCKCVYYCVWLHLPQ